MAAVDYPLSGAPQYALTTGPRVARTMSPVSQLDLVNQISQALLDAGWVFTAAIPSGGGIVSGQRLSCLSPQSYALRVDVTWGPNGQFGRNPVWITFNTAATRGIRHTIDFQNGIVYQIIANQCSLFISRPGVTYTSAGSAVCGGIPYVDTGCGFGTEALTEIWFAFGDWVDSLGNIGGHSKNPRLALSTDAGSEGGITFNGAQEGVSNGTLVTGNGIGVPQILKIESGNDDSFITGFGSYAHAWWVDGLPLKFPAFVAWGADIASGTKIRGQIYDAICRSKGYDMDTTGRWDGFIWTNYTHQYYWGSLWLITGMDTQLPAPVLNIAY